MTDDEMTDEEKFDRDMSSQIIQEYGVDYTRVIKSEFNKRIVQHLPKGKPDESGNSLSSELRGECWEFIDKTIDGILYIQYGDGYIDSLKEQGFHTRIDYLLNSHKESKDSHTSDEIK
jgi:hypothetical protein